jgi:CoA:oxalate CoA-transferase
MHAQPSDEAVLKILEEHRVAAAPVMTVVDTVSHPHYKARNMIRTVPDPILGEVMIPGFPLKFSAFPKALEITAPMLGEHGAGVLREQLGMSDAEISRLQSQGVLHSENK